MSGANTKSSKADRMLARQRAIQTELRGLKLALIPVIDHCRRLVTEKEILREQLDAARTANRGLAEANRYMSLPTVRQRLDCDSNCRPGYPHEPDCAWWD